MYSTPDPIMNNARIEHALSNPYIWVNQPEIIGPENWPIAIADVKLYNNKFLYIAEDMFATSNLLDGY